MKKRWLLILSLASPGCTQSAVPAGRQVARVAVQTQAEAAEPADHAPTTSLVLHSAENRKPVDAASDEFGSAIAKAHPERAKAMVAAAAKACEATKACYEMGTTTLANLHHWSRQLALAERALAQTKEEDQAALLAYWKRSKQTYLKVRALYNTGTHGGEAENFGAAAYYLSEAELWLEAAGGKVPENID